MKNQEPLTLQQVKDARASMAEHFVMAPGLIDAFNQLEEIVQQQQNEDESK